MLALCHERCPHRICVQVVEFNFGLRAEKKVNSVTKIQNDKTSFPRLVEHFSSEIYYGGHVLLLWFLSYFERLKECHDLHKPFDQFLIDFLRRHACNPEVFQKTKAYPRRKKQHNLWTQGFSRWRKYFARCFEKLREVKVNSKHIPACSNMLQTSSREEIFIF